MVISFKTHISSVLIFIRTYYHYILLAGAVLVASFVISVYNNIDTHFQYLNYLINENIKEYNEIDLEHICSLTSCNEIYLQNGETYSLFKKEKFLIYEHEVQDCDFPKFNDNIYISYSKLLLYNQKAKAYVSINYKEKIHELYHGFVMLFVLLLITIFYLLFKTFKKERNAAMLHAIGNEAILANKSMVVITENIHHELNTPIEVIDNKITKIYNVLHEYIDNEYNSAVRSGEDLAVINQRKSGKKINKLDKDFDFIKTSIEQIFSILNKMKNFKSLRYSNGNKTLYDIIDGSFRIIAVSNSDFDYRIDMNFKKYKMISPILKNVDLLNVLINHIKNSLEANSNFIEVKSEFLNITSELKIIIKDNGAGIPDNTIKNIFEPNFSTKQIGDSIRGNGMYLNKYIVNQAGGDICVKQREPRGTIVTVKIPIAEV